SCPGRERGARSSREPRAARSGRRRAEATPAGPGVARPGASRRRGRAFSRIVFDVFGGVQPRFLPESKRAWCDVRPMTLDRVHAELVRCGAKPVHVRRIVRAWLRGERIDARGGPRAAPFPRAIAERLEAIEASLDAIAAPISEHPGEDGSLRSLLR